ncbi:MAG TPA: SCO family protein [Chitinophagaceae bacterium]|nr:SCO family protein [Chitinophagaceae bacterium]
MNKTAIKALCIAIILPVLSYILVKYYSNDAIIMPKHFYYDTVLTTTENGKTSTDTIWHSVQNISLTNQLNQSISLNDIQGKIIIIDFFFTHCPSICPMLTQNMHKLQASFKNPSGKNVADSMIVQFLSFSVDPERDSVAALKAYADKYRIDHNSWWMLTGNKKTIYDFGINELKLGLVDGEGVDTSFIHTDRFVLLDKNHVLRGYYNGLDTTSLAKLAEDVGKLMLEKDKHEKRNLFRK